MGLSYDDTRRLFNAGRYQDILSRCGTDDTALAELTTAHRLLIAHMLTLSDAGRAAEIAQRDDTPDAPPGVRAQCELIVGIARRREGAVRQAHAHFQRAIQLGREAGDAEITAWAHLHLFRLLAEVEPNAASVAALREVRAAVARAADPHAAACLHDTITFIEGSSGRLDEARRHLAITASLLEQHPNAWLSQLSASSASIVAFFQCDYAAAARHIHAAKRLMPTTGAAYLNGIVEANEGHVLLASGHFDAAEKVLQRLASTSGNIATRLGVLEGLARLYLAQDRLDECARKLQEIEALQATDPKLATGFSSRWTSVTQAKLYLRQRLWARAHDTAGHELLPARRLGDLPMVAALSGVQAEAAAAAGQPRDASLALLAASDAGAAAMPARQAEFYHAVAATLESSAAPVAERIRIRAHAIWRLHADHLGPLENAHAGTSSVAHETVTSCPVDLQPAVIADALAAAFDLAHQPGLMGAELVNAITTLRCSPHVAIEESRPGEPLPLQTDEQYTLFLGEQGGSRLTLVCGAPDNPLSATLLGDVLRLGGAAVALERAHHTERTRAALWPAHPLDVQQDGLFIAEEMQALVETARRVAATNVPVLIMGETGTGKEVLARIIHACSTRASGDFLPFNCSAVPKEMLDSQLFGHRKGAFTGAHDHFPGVIRAASGGTLFLDEIGDLTLEAQPKLLRFLESGDVHPIGEAKPVHADARVIAATNADLDARVADGRFRDNLFYRLAIVRLQLPPLRARRVEIPALADHYLQKHAREFGKGDVRLAEETMEYLLLYRWPGNVRQLANEMRRLAVIAEPGAVLMPEHLSADIAASRRTIPPSERAVDATELVVRLDQPMAAVMEHVERAMIQYTLGECGGNVERTAAMLGVSRKGLYLKRQRFAGEE